MKIQRAAIGFAILFLVSLTACDVISNNTPTLPPATPTRPAASPTTVAMATSPTVAAAAATATTNSVAPTSTPVMLDLPTVTPAPPTAAPSSSATDTPASAPNTTPTTGRVSASSSKLIFYLGSDGIIYTVKPDGSNKQPLLKIDIPAGQDVAGMSASVDGKFLAYKLVDTATYEDASYYLVSNGKASKLDGVASLPVWYGHRFVASGSVGEGGTPGDLAVYNADAAGGPSGAGLGVQGSNLAWYPDGSNILYLDALDNIYSIGTNPPPYGNYTGTLVLHLNDKPADNNPDFFGAMFAAVTPDGKTLVFGGEQIKNVGASGNGQRLWMYDLSKGPGKALAAAQSFTDFGGRYGSNNYGFANMNTLVVASDFHISACAVGSAIDVLGIGNAVTATVALPGQQGDSNARLYGLSVAPANPNHPSSTFAYSLDNYTCANAGTGPTVTLAATVYVWSGGQSSKVAAGRYPLWADTSIAVAPAPTPIPGESNPPTATPQSYTPGPTFGSGELIFYLASDGQTIDTMKPDGSDAGKLVIKVDRQPGEIITGLSASKDGKYLVYNLTLTSGTYDVTDYYLVAGGKATKLSGIGKPPVWFANYFVAAAPTSSNASEATEIYRIFPASANDPANFMVDSGVTGTLYTLFPDGTQLVYVDASGNIMALGLSHMTEHKPYTLVSLNPTAKQGDADFFEVAWLNFAPDGTLVFAGGKQSDLGPFGTGAKVWIHKLSANSADPPQPLSDTGRYDDYDFIGQTALVVNSAEHGGVCGSIPHLKTLDFSTQSVSENPIPGSSPDRRYTIYGLSGAPFNANRTSYAYSAEPYTCGSDNTAKGSGTSSIYVWTSANSAPSTKIGEGRFPVWVDTKLLTPHLSTAYTRSGCASLIGVNSAATVNASPPRPIASRIGCAP